MANQNELAIVVNARDQASRQVRNISGSLGGLVQRAVGIYALVKAFRELKQALSASVQAFIEFDRVLHNVWTLVDQTWGQMRGLGQQIRNLAYDFNVTAAQATTALYQIYSATFYGVDAFQILEASIKGAAAGLSDVFNVADMLTTVLNAYRMSSEQAAHVNDLLFTTIKYGKTTMSELAHQFGRLAGVAAPAGAQIHEMTAAIATLTRQGIATDWAITSLRQTIMQILRPGKELAEVIAMLGYESGRALFEGVGFADAVGMIASYADMAGLRIEQLFSNVRAVTAVLPLATKAADEYAKDLARMAKSAGAAEVAFGKQTESLRYQIDVMKTKFTELGVTIGEKFSWFIQDAIDKLGNLADRIRTFLSDIPGPPAGKIFTEEGWLIPEDFFPGRDALIENAAAAGREAAESFVAQYGEAMEKGATFQYRLREMLVFGPDRFVGTEQEIRASFQAFAQALAEEFSASYVRKVFEGLPEAGYIDWVLIEPLHDIEQAAARTGLAFTEGLGPSLGVAGLEVFNASQKVDELVGELQSGNISFTRAAEILAEMGEMAEFWSQMAAYAAAEGWDSADAAQRLAVRLEELTGAAVSAASAVDIFYAAMSKIADAGAELATSMSLMDEMVGSAAAMKAYRENLERIITGTGPADLRAWAEQELAGLPTDIEGVFGQTFQQIADDAERAAKEAQRAAEQAARDAERAAREALQAAQEAFRGQFQAPLLEAISSRDFVGAAQSIQDLIADLDTHLAEGGKLGIGAAEVLGLISGMESELVSTAESMAELGYISEDLVQQLKDLLDPLGDLKRQLREITGEALIYPTIAGQQLRELAMGIAGRSPAESLMELSKGAGEAYRCVGNLCYEVEDFIEQTSAATDIQATVTEALTGNAAALDELRASAQLGGEEWVLIMEAIRTGRSSFEDLIRDFEILGLDTSNLEQSLEEFDAALQGTTVAALRWRDIVRDIGNTLWSSFKDLIHGLLGDLLGIAEETSAALASHNIPHGFKLARAAWGVARPGQPWGEEEGDGGFSITDWFQSLVQSLLDVLGNAITTWFENLDIDWDTVFANIWGAVYPLIEGLFQTLYAAVLPFFEFLFGSGSGLASSLAKLIAGLVTLSVTAFALGMIIGTVEGALAVLWGAVLGIVDALKAFFKPVLEEIKASWEKLQPLVEAVRSVFAALSPVTSAFGQVIAMGIQFMTNLFVAMAPLISVVGEVVSLFATILSPAILAVGYALQVVLYPIQVLFWVIECFSVGLHNAIEHIKDLSPFYAGDYWKYPEMPAPLQLQTLPGEFWRVQQSGYAVVDKGEIVGRPAMGDVYNYHIGQIVANDPVEFERRLEEYVHNKRVRSSSIYNRTAYQGA